jgi:PUB domain
MKDEEEKANPAKKTKIPASGSLTPVEYLKLFYAEAGDDSSVILKSLKTMITILSNLVQNPMEPKYRSLDKTKKPIQEKILNFQSLVEFLKCCGFEDKDNELLLKGFPGEVLNKALDSIYEELKVNEQAFGVKVSSSFNPYAENIVSRAGKGVSSEGGDSNTYDPAFVDKMIQEEKKFKRKLMERKVEDREIQVFNSLSNTSDFKKILQQYEEENLKDDNDYEEELRKLSALKLMGKQDIYID